MIVVDASALAAFILKEPGWKTLAKHLVYAYSVDHVVKETANAIWKAAVRKAVGEEEAMRLYRLLARMIGKNIILEPEGDYVEKALEIALKHKVTVYDALYIALAEEKNLPLLTLDEKQARTAEELGVRIVKAF